MLSKLPKLVLLTKLLPFLDEDELNKVASICKVLRKLIYSPMGLKIIVYNRTRRMAEYFRDNVMSKASYNVIHDHPAAHGPGGALSGLSRKDLERAQVRPSHTDSRRQFEGGPSRRDPKSSQCEEIPHGTTRKKQN